MVSRFFFRYTGRRLHLSGAPVFSVKPRYPLAVLFSSFFGGQLCELCREKYLARSSLEYSRPLGASLCIVALGMDADGSYHAVVVSVLMRNAEGALRVEPCAVWAVSKRFLPLPLSWFLCGSFLAR